MSIKAKSYAIGTTETPFAEPGTRFYLLAASEPMTIKLYRDTQIVGEADGFVGGLELGPFCEPFTRWSAQTQSGKAGSVLVGVGDDPMAYNPLAGTLSFSNPLAGTSATQPATPSASSASVSAGNAYSAIFTVPAQAGLQSYFQISAGGYPDPKTITIKKIVLRNPTATAQVFNIGRMASQMIGAVGTVNAQNLLSGGAVSAFSFNTGGTSLNPPTGWAYSFSRQVDANSELEIDLADNPVIGQEGTTTYPTIYCTTLDAAIAGEVIWEEA